MQNKQYTIQFFSLPNNQLRSQSLSSDCGTRRFHGFSEKIWTLGKKRIPAPRQTPIRKLSMTSMVWNISTSQLGCLPGCAPSQLLHTCSSAECGRLEKVLDFLATAENISVLSIFFSYQIQNPAATGRKSKSIPAKTRTLVYYVILVPTASHLPSWNFSWLITLSILKAHYYHMI